MKSEKIISTIIILLTFFIVDIDGIHAQPTKSPQQIKILNNYGSIPFEDGKTAIAEVKFIGLDSDYEEYDESVGNKLPESDCRRLLRENRATISADDKFYGAKVSKVVKLIREWLDSKGYDRAEIIAFGEKLPKNQMILTFSIKRGLLANVSDIRFEGNLNITNEEYVADFKQCIGDSWKIFDSRKYNFITRKCSRSLMFSKGYFQGKIRNINRVLVQDNYIVTVEVEEGIRYRIGEIKIDGAKVFSEKAILEKFGQKEGDIVDGKALQNFFFDELRSIYLDKGYLLFAAEFEPTFIEPLADGLDATVNLHITIDEGPQFKLTKIEFWGVEKEKARELRKLFSLKDGDIYSQSQMEEGIKKINETKEFYFVDKDQDVELRTDEEGNDIELLIKLTKIEQ